VLDRLELAQRREQPPGRPAAAVVDRVEQFGQHRVRQHFSTRRQAFRAAEALELCGLDIDLKPGRPRPGTIRAARLRACPSSCWARCRITQIA
jgi:hypothetical protein